MKNSTPFFKVLLWDKTKRVNLKVFKRGGLEGAGNAAELNLIKEVGLYDLGLMVRRRKVRGVTRDTGPLVAHPEAIGQACTKVGSKVLIGVVFKEVT